MREEKRKMKVLKTSSPNWGLSPREYNKVVSSLRVNTAYYTSALIYLKILEKMLGN